MIIHSIIMQVVSRIISYFVTGSTTSISQCNNWFNWNIDKIPYQSLLLSYVYSLILPMIIEAISYTV